MSDKMRSLEPEFQVEGEILDAIELTPKELEYENTREAVQKKYDDKKAELETAKLQLVKQYGKD